MAQGGSNWWRDGIIYQIYPRSFQDSNGDGIGDLAGILAAAATYLQSLGVDAVWLSPIYPSPMADFGYDISDYTGIDPLFGTLADFDALLAAAHAPRPEADPRPRAEPHFRPASLVRREPLLARQSRSATGTSGATRRPDGGPPNNWLRDFGGSAWEFDDDDRPVLLPRLPRRSSRTSTGAIPTSARPCYDVHALLARPRRRRLPRRRDLAPDQGRPVPRQPAQSALSPRAGRRIEQLLHAILHRPARGARRHRRMRARHRRVSTTAC